MAVDNARPLQACSDGGLYCYPLHKKIAAGEQLIPCTVAIRGVACALGHNLINDSVMSGSI